MISTLSGPDRKDSEWEARAKNRKSAKSQSQGTRAKSVIQTLLAMGGEAARQEPGRAQSRKEANVEQIKEDPGRLSKRVWE